MIKLLALSILFSMNVFASETIKTSFSIFPNSGANRAFYACDFVESKTEQIIEALGGEVTRISCFGGIQPGGMGYPTPNNVRVTFNRPKAEMGEVEVIELRDNRDCHLVTNIVNALEKSFPIDDISGTGHCFNPNSSYRIKITIRR